jgi:hypothetical protein
MLGPLHSKSWHFHFCLSVYLSVYANHEPQKQASEKKDKIGKDVPEEGARVGLSPPYAPQSH